MAKNPYKAPASKAGQGRASKKISTLHKEGVPQKQAVATALNMERKGQLGPKGGYKKKKK
jgi:hypothetical protein